MAFILIKDNFIIWADADPLKTEDYDSVLNMCIGAMENSANSGIPDLNVLHMLAFIREAVNHPEYSSINLLRQFRTVYYEGDPQNPVFDGFNCADSGSIYTDTAAAIAPHIGDVSKTLEILSRSDKVEDMQYIINGQNDSHEIIQYVYAMLHSKFSQGKVLKKCETCNRYFMTKFRTNEKYCSDTCKRKAKTQRQIKYHSQPLQYEYGRIYNLLRQKEIRLMDGCRDEAAAVVAEEKRQFMDGYKKLSSDTERKIYLEEWGREYPKKKG